jgi:hypothetical protein
MKPDELVEMGATIEQMRTMLYCHTGCRRCRLSPEGANAARTLLVWYCVAMKRLASDVKTFPASIFQTGPILEKT